LTGLFLPLLAGRRATGVVVCEVAGLKVGRVVVGVPLLWFELKEGDGSGGAGDLALEPVDVVDRKEAELGVFRNVGLPVVLDPVEL
jgi:hypothetical protein